MKKLTQKAILEFAAWQRSYLAGVDSYDPAELRDASHVEHGLLINQWRMFVSMCHEWSCLAKDLETMTNAVAALDWTVNPACLDGEDPTPLAQEVAKTVQNAIWARGEAEQGTWSHDFLDLVQAVCHAKYRGHNVHEIIWGRNAHMVYPAEFKPVPPLFYFWTTGPQEADRLLLCPEGYGTGPGVPFPPDKFIVALNNSGPDHPTQNAVLNALVGWFGASKFGMSFLMQYCQIAGMPIRKYKCKNDKDRQKLMQQIQANPVLSDAFITEPNDLEIINAAAAGASIPQAVVLDMAERACHKLILGNTLTSDTTADGGSRAQAEVHMDVQTQAVLQMGNYVAGILNRQLVPAVIRKNYGHLEGLPLPELRCSVPDAGVNMDRLDFYCKFVNELGGRVAWSTIYDQCGVPMPGPDDDVAGPPAQPGTADPLSAAAAARYGTSAMQRAERRAQAAERAAEPVAAAFMHPVLQSLADAVKTGAGPEQMKRILDNSATNADVLADALVEVTRSALGVGQGETVEAGSGRLPNPVNMPGGERCYTENCSRHKGTTREPKSTGKVDKAYKVDQGQPMHKQVSDLAAAIERASKDGTHFQAVIERPEFGKLNIDCGRPGENNKQDSGGHGAKHAFEGRHNVSLRGVAEALLLGTVEQSEKYPSRLILKHGKVSVVLEREIIKGSGRISKTRAKFFNAIHA